MEIITGVGRRRRRRWRPEDQLRILAELAEPGVRFAGIARRHEASRGLLWQWRDARRRGTSVAEEASVAPVRVVPELPAPASPAGPSASPPSTGPAVERDGRIGIALPDGAAPRVPGTIGTTALRRVPSAPRG